MVFILAIIFYIALFALFLIFPALTSAYVPFLLAITPIYILYFFISYKIVKTKKIPWSLIIAGFVFTALVFLPKKPLLSHDIYRYLWDGMLLKQGINPYLFRPQDPALANNHTIPLYKDVDWKYSYTVYPPFTQLFFWLVYKAYEALGLSGAKIIIYIPFLVFIVFLCKMGFKKLTAILLLNPLIVSEIFYSAHIDSLTILFTFLCIFLYFNKRVYLSFVFAALAFLTKVYPAILVPLFLVDLIRKRKLKRAAVSLSIFLAISIIAWYPFIKESLSPILHYLSFLDEQEYNASIYRYTYQILGSPGSAQKAIAKYVSFGFFAITYLILLTRKLSIHLILAAQVVLLLSLSALFPWYTLFLIPTVLIAVKQTKNYKLLTPLFIAQFIITWIYFEPGIYSLRDLMLNLEYAIFIILIIFYTKNILVHS